MPTERLFGETNKSRSSYTTTPMNKSCDKKWPSCGNPAHSFNKMHLPPPPRPLSAEARPQKKKRKKRKWWIYSLPPCMQVLWRLCCNEAVCIMHEPSFERHAAPNVVIFCHPPSLPFPHSALPSWLTVLLFLLETDCYSVVHCVFIWLIIFFCALLAHRWIAALVRRRKRRKGQSNSREKDEL